jgi:hypothetical protein
LTSICMDNCVPKNWCSWIQDGFLVLSKDTTATHVQAS